mmetsp:Transcript_8/g.20  ORF Transcript_8/g.20 Transcript_8/m.20 type:complete len:331 (+) Transcript_8:583-1575(+)
MEGLHFPESIPARSFQRPRQHGRRTRASDLIRRRVWSSAVLHLETLLRRTWAERLILLLHIRPSPRQRPPQSARIDVLVVVVTLLKLLLIVIVCGLLWRRLGPAVGAEVPGNSAEDATHLLLLDPSQALDVRLAEVGLVMPREQMLALVALYPFGGRFPSDALGDASDLLDLQDHRLPEVHTSPCKNGAVILGVALCGHAAADGLLMLRGGTGSGVLQVERKARESGELILDNGTEALLPRPALPRLPPAPRPHRGRGHHTCAASGGRPRAPTRGHGRAAHAAAAVPEEGQLPILLVHVQKHAAHPCGEPATTGAHLGVPLRFLLKLLIR